MEYHEILQGAQNNYHCDAVIIATGASAKWLGLESEEKFGQNMDNMRAGRLQRGSRRELVTGP